MQVSTFAEIQTEFLARVSGAIYCSMATLDRQDRPRSRMMHSIWETSGDLANSLIGWVISWPQTHKTKHLARNPYISLAYIQDKHKPVYVDCRAEWIHDTDEQWRIWALHKTTPPPLGFDPEPHFSTIEHEHFGVLKFTPWRVELGNLCGEPIVWRPHNETG